MTTPEPTGRDLRPEKNSHVFPKEFLSGILGCAAIIGADGAFRFANREFLRFAGLPESEINGRPVPELLGQAFLEACLATAASLGPMRSQRDEGWVDCGPLGRRRVEWAITALPPDGKGRRDVMVVLRDLTEQTAQGQELAERIAAHSASEAYHAAIVDNALDAIVVIDETGAVIDFNPAAVSIFGYRRAEAMGRQIGDLIIPAHLREAHDRGLKAYLRSGESRVLGRRLELEGQRSDGSLLPIELTITEVREGSRRLFAAHLRDLTAFRQAREEIDRQREALHQKEKLAALGSLLAGVAHELNNPLSIVLGQATILSEKLAVGQAVSEPHSFPPVGMKDLAQRAAKIEAAAGRCARVVRSFLDMARQRKREQRAVRLRDVVGSALDLLGYTLRSSGVAVEIDMPEGLPPVWGDPDQLHQVVVNLIVNACQSLEAKSTETRRIALRASNEPEQGTVALRVADNGGGISAAIRSRVFDPFFTTKPQGTGTGIGLAVSRGLVEAHGGTLDIEDAAGAEGACFLIRLPAGRWHPEPEEVEAPELQRLRPSQRHVLVIDDEAEVAGLLAEVVERLGFAAIVAEGGRAAKEHLDGRRLDPRLPAIDAILCDIRMPDGDGPAFFDWLVTNHPGMTERIGFVTGDTLGSAAGRFLARSGCPVIEKPFLPQDVRRVLSSLTANGGQD